MRILDKENILDLADYGELVDALIKVSTNLEAGKINLPLRSHVNFDGNTLLLMPCSDHGFLASNW